MAGKGTNAAAGPRGGPAAPPTTPTDTATPKAPDADGATDPTTTGTNAGTDDADADQGDDDEDDELADEPLPPAPTAPMVYASGTTSLEAPHVDWIHRLVDRVETAFTRDAGEVEQEAGEAFEFLAKEIRRLLHRPTA